MSQRESEALFSRFGGDTRGVSEVIGAILVFGIIVLLLSVFQTTAVPMANEDVEYKHSQAVQDDFIEFHDTAAQMSRTGEGDSTPVRLGTQYPTRLLFFNPPAPAGSVRTGPQQEAAIHNVTAVNPTVRKSVNGSVENLTTRNITYQPDYNQYTDAPTTRYEYGLLYNNFSESQLVVNDGGVIAGKDISLLMPAGNLSEQSTGAVSIETRPASAPANAVSVTGNGTGPVVLELPSQLNASVWKDAVDMTHVQSIANTGNGSVRIALDPSQTYSLSMARVGVGDDPAPQNATYLYSNDGTQLTIPQGQTNIVDVEVRDRYNTPVSGETVRLRVDGSGSVASTVAQSGPDGSVDARFNAPTTPTQTTIQATLDGGFSNFDAENNSEDIEIEVWVTRFAGGVGNTPEVTFDDLEVGCGSAGIGDFIDNPIGSISGNPGTASVEWTATLTGTQTDLDTVDLRLINTDNGRVVDTATYAYDEENQASQSKTEQTQLVSETDNCASEYKIRILAQSTGGATDIKTETRSP
jgi:hypothetical protein